MAANSNAGQTFEISTTTSIIDIVDAAAYGALTYVLVGSVGKIGSRGIDTNMLTYTTLDEAVAQKAKGVTNAGDPEIECARVVADAGQIAMRAAGAIAVRVPYMFRITDADGSIFFNRGLVSGPMRPGGGVEDFVLEVYKLALVQEEIEV